MKTMMQMAVDAEQQKTIDKLAVKMLRTLALSIERGEKHVDGVAHSRNWERKEKSGDEDMPDWFIDLNEWEMKISYHVNHRKNA